MPLPDTGRAERAAWLRLVLTPGIGPVTARELLGVFGLPEDVIGAGRAALARAAGDRIAAALCASNPERDRQVEAALDWAQDPDNHLVCLSDPEYPARLFEIGDPPPLLYVRGSPAILSRPALAIVGSRSASRSGADTARAFARALADSGLTITSGLAQGIDTAAHLGALGTTAGTIAVLGTGIDIAYPSANRPLAGRIVADGGALVAEAPVGTGPRSANFPRRNRIIAGLSLGVLVVEAAMRSGSLITARQAGEFGREVMAIPGSIHSPLSKGCHHLIKQGAKLVESARDILAELPAPARSGKARPPPGTKPEPADDPVLQALGWDPRSAEELASTLAAQGTGPGEIAARLLALELDGCVEQLADGRYQRRPPHVH